MKFLSGGKLIQLLEWLKVKVELKYVSFALNKLKCQMNFICTYWDLAVAKKIFACINMTVIVSRVFSYPRSQRDEDERSRRCKLSQFPICFTKLFSLELKLTGVGGTSNWIWSCYRLQLWWSLYPFLYIRHWVGMQASTSALPARSKCKDPLVFHTFPPCCICTLASVIPKGQRSESFPRAKSNGI